MNAYTGVRRRKRAVVMIAVVTLVSSLTTSFASAAMVGESGVSPGSVEGPSSASVGLAAPDGLFTGSGIGDQSECGAGFGAGSGAAPMVGPARELPEACAAEGGVADEEPDSPHGRYAEHAKQYGDRGCRVVAGFNDRCPVMTSWPYREPNDGAVQPRALLGSPDGETLYAVLWTSGRDRNGVEYSATVISAYRGDNGGADAGEVLWVRTFGGLSSDLLDDDQAYRLAKPWHAALSHDGRRLYVIGVGNYNVGLPPIDGWIAAFDTADGSLVWERKSGELISKPELLAASPEGIAVSPDDRHVYLTVGAAYPTYGGAYVRHVANAGMADQDTWFAALDAGDGSVAWKANYAENTPNFSNPWLANTLAVSSDGATLFGQVVLQNDDFSNRGFATVAYNATTGEQMWADSHVFPAEDGRQNAPRGLVVSPDGSQVFVAAIHHRGDRNTGRFLVVGYDAATGERSWFREHSAAAGTGCEENFLDVATMQRAVAVSPSGRYVYLVGQAGYAGGCTGADELHTATAVLAVHGATGEVAWQRVFGAEDGAWSCFVFVCNIDVSREGAGDNGSQVLITTRYLPKAAGRSYQVTLAFDGVTGKRLWRGRYLDTYNDGQTRFGALSDSVVSSDNTRLYVLNLEYSPTRGWMPSVAQIIGFDIQREVPADENRP